MSNPSLLADYLFIGPLIEARLAEQLGENIAVESIEQMSQVRDNAELRELVVYVMWGGDRFNTTEGGRAGAGASQQVYQRWIVWVRVRNESQADLAARNRRAGPVLSATHKALAGWMPEGGLRPFVRAQGPTPDYRTTSGLYPLAFEINMAL